MSDDLVSVLWTSSWVEAEIAKGRLEAESIPVQLKGEGADAPLPVGPAELLVPPRFEEEARRILAQDEDGSDRSRAWPVASALLILAGEHPAKIYDFAGLVLAVVIGYIGGE